LTTVDKPGKARSRSPGAKVERRLRLTEAEALFEVEGGPPLLRKEAFRPAAVVALGVGELRLWSWELGTRMEALGVL
jgi:hypothetical protein